MVGAFEPLKGVAATNTTPAGNVSLNTGEFKIKLPLLPPLEAVSL